MKALYITAMASVVALLYICIVKVNKSDRQIAGSVKRVLQVAIVAALANLFTVVGKAELICMLEFTVYMIATDWMLYCVLCFAMEYTNNRFRGSIWKKILVAVIFLDMFSMLANLFLHQVFVLEPVMVRNRLQYFNLMPGDYFSLHLAVIYFLAAYSVVVVLIKFMRSPVIYRNKYLVVSVGMTLAIVLSVCFYLLNLFSEGFDYGMIAFGLEGVCIYYCALVFTPQQLVMRTLTYVEYDLSTALIVMDMDGEWVHLNKSAENLLSEVDRVTDENGMTLRAWCMNRYLDCDEGFEENRSFMRHGRPVYLKIQFNQMTDTKNRLVGSFFMIQDRTEEEESLNLERYRNAHDELTGLYNKEHFFQKVEERLRQNSSRTHYMIVSDVKNFKLINDVFGNKQGDAILCQIADTLREMVTSEEMIYGRLGNDRFGLLVPKDLHSEEVLLAGLERVTHIEGQKEYTMIIHVGIYEITDINIPVSVMCDRALMALSMIKGDYQMRIAYYDETLRKTALREQELTRELERAIEQQHLTMYLQPQVSVDGKALGAEALIRWKHPRQGMITPGEFIPVFEKNGMIAQVDRYMWEAACRQVRKWNDAGETKMYISVNISPKDFYFLDVCGTFQNLVQKYEISPRQLKLEITETAIMMNLQRQLELIEKLRQAGFIVEMDDFGSGYSSLNMLKDIKVDILKIDMAFLRKSEDEPRGRKILQMIISLSRQLGMPVITEGVETLEQVEFLSEMGCDIFQGYYFAKPMEVSEFEERYMGMVRVAQM